MTKILIDAQKSTNDFLMEANKCALQKLGFAAMLTIFPVILSISETIQPVTSSDDKDLFKKFVPYMVDKSWMIFRDPTSSLSDQAMALDLFDVRSGLTHQLSLPNHIGMINTKSEAKEYFKDHLGINRVISVVEFVDEVSRTVGTLIKMNPTAPFDLNPKGSSRSPAEKVLLSGTTSSASSPR